jgi:CheY-like chemotaxis protein
MSTQTPARIFEPCFTATGSRNAALLGSATVDDIVQQAGGHIGVYSEVGCGTTFKVYLPPADERAQSADLPSGGRTTPHGNESILLVDDEDAVRGLTRLALEMYGYRVIEARNGADALRHCARRDRPIHLLITDVVMSQMGGRELAQRLTANTPGIRVLYLSGYSDAAVVRHGILEADVAFLQKPFTAVALAQKVREVLDQ